MPEKLRQNIMGNPAEAAPATFEMSEKLKKAVETFFKFLRIEDKPESSDSIFILGGASLAPVKKASELYAAGYSTKIGFISTGGNFGGDKVWGIPEDVKYRETLLQSGVPEGAVVSKGLTSNTLAEAKAAIPFLKDGGVDPKKVILVARPTHQRRAFDTFRQQNPDTTFINCPADEPLDFNDIDTMKRLVAEAERLLDYSKKGDIAKQDISLEVLKAAAIIRMELKNRGEYSFRTKPPEKV